MNRPDTEAFWKLSQILIATDEQAEREQSVETIVKGIIDVDTLVYVAQQRAFRSLNIETEEQYRRHIKEVALKTATWMDGFVTGYKYAKAQND